MAGAATASVATVLSLGVADTHTANGDTEVWWRITVGTTGTYRFDLKCASPSDAAYVDVYRLTGSDPPAEPPWSDINDWVGWVGDDMLQDEYAGVQLEAGEVYIIAGYHQNFSSAVPTFDIEVNGPGGPSNNRVSNAQLLATGSGVTVVGTTAGSSREFEEFDDWGGMSPSVWYKVEVGGPGYMSYDIKSNTPGFHPYVDLAYQVGGPPTTYNDLDQDIGSEEVGDGTEDPPFRKYDQEGGSMADLAPLAGGEVFYFMVSSYEQDEYYENGSFEFTVSTPGEAFCLDAEDYIFGASPSSSVVSGSVRETQIIEESELDPFEGRYGDLNKTLSIPGADILAAAGDSSPGFYAVTLKTKNNTSGNGSGLAALVRNDHPLHPGAFLDSSTDGTLYTDFLTVPAGANFPSPDKPVFLNMTWYLPVHEDDTIDLIVAGATFGAFTIDITQICFQRIKDAVEAPAYAILDIPDYPLGTTGADVADTNPEQAGDLVPYKGTAPIYHEHDANGMDMVVTDDGTIWCLVTYLECFTVSSGTKIIGPYLMKYSGGSWSMVNDDIEGLGVKRNPASFSTFFEPYNGSMCTDGEDIWIAYGVDAGLGFGGAGSGRDVNIKVKKYDVSANSWSTVGSPFCGPHPTLGIEEAGDFGETPIIGITPGGDLWCAFTDLGDRDPLVNESGLASAREYDGQFAYVAQFTGGSWVVHGPLATSWYEPYAFTRYKAKDYRNTGSGTTSEVTEDSEVCVRETQTAATADTIKIIPPAGKWMWRARVEYNRAAGTGGVAMKSYKNGTQISAATNEGAFSSASNPVWAWSFSSTQPAYQEFNGTTDELSIRIWRTGTATEVFIDEFVLIEAKYGILERGFGQQARFVDDGQPNVALWCGTNNPAVLVPMASVIYTEDTDAEGYVPPGEIITNFALAWQAWVYFEWDGSEFERKWEKLIEDDIPNHLYIVTREDSIASTPPFGHYQQGMGFCLGPDGDQYFAANLGGGQAFGFFGDAIVACKVDDTGFVPFTEASPTTLGGAGYPAGFTLGLSGFSGWGWTIGQRSIHVDTNGEVWLGWPLSGPMVNAMDFIGHHVDTGTGGWLSAGFTNEEMGYDAIEGHQPLLGSSPDGSKVYAFFDAEIFGDWVIGANVPTTLGVWECDVIPEHRIPLIPILRGAIDLARIRLRAFFIGDA